MAQILQSVRKPFADIVPEVKKGGIKGALGTSITGIGFGTILRVIDGFIPGQPLQSFGVNTPIGRIDVTKTINYIVHNKGAIIPRKDLKGVIAVVADTIVQAGFSAGSVQLPGSFGRTEELRSAPGETAGLPGGGLF